MASLSSSASRSSSWSTSPQPALLMSRTQYENAMKATAATTASASADPSSSTSSTLAATTIATSTATNTSSAAGSTSHGTFNVLPTKLTSSIPAQLKYHVHGAFDAPSPSILSTVCTTYSTAHNFKFAPYYDTMKPSMPDQQTGYTRRMHNTSVLTSDHPDAGGNGLGQSHVAEDLQGNNEVVHPPRSDAHRSYRSPADLERQSGVPRGHVDLHPDRGDLWEETKRKSGYVQNHRFFYDPSHRPLGQSHSSGVFVQPRPSTVPPYGASPTAPVNGFTRNQAYVPRQQSINEGAEVHPQARYSSTYSELGVSATAKHLPRNASLAYDDVSVAKRKGWRASDSNGFTRSEVLAPVDGSGTNHTKLWKDASYAARHHGSDGVRSALQWKHKYDSTRVPIGETRVSIDPVDAPSKPQSMLRWGSGTGKDASQQVHELRKLQRTDPVECVYQLSGAPALASTYALVHGAVAAAQQQGEEKESAAAPASSSSASSSSHRPAYKHSAASATCVPGTQESWKEARREATCMESGGVTRPYESSMQRQNAIVQRVKESIEASGQSVAPSSDTRTGYTQNYARDVPMATRVSHDAYTGKAMQKHGGVGYAITTHEMFRAPSVSALSSAKPPHVIEGLAQSAYSREHKDQLSPIDDGLFYLRTETQGIVPTRRDADSRQPVVQRIMLLSEPGSIPVVRGDVRAEQQQAAAARV